MHRSFAGIPILLVAAALVAPEASARAPEPVSPAGAVGERCPTFSWSGVPGAPGYELVVYRVAEDVAEEPLLVARVPGGATAWTPGGDCLEAGGSYAWTLRVVGEAADGAGAEDWSEPALFRVSAAPSPDELEEALATLRRYLAETRRSPPEARATGGGGDGRPGEAAERRSLESAAATPSPGAPPVRNRSRQGAAGGTVEGGVREPTADSGGEPRSIGAASVPSLGTPSLSLSSNLALGAASNLFKDGAVFLWDDTAGNTALGRDALASATGDATRNTALGREALRDTVEGGVATEGSENTALGDFALRANTTGHHNTATGFQSLQANTTGFLNTATGSGALSSNTSGRSNTAAGADALSANDTGYRNTATGHEALLANTSGFTNTAAGAGALAANTTGYGNTAVGADALSSNTEGDRNVAVGESAGSNVTTGSDNVFILNEGVAGDSGTIRIGTEGVQDGTFISGIFGTTTGNDDAVSVMIDSAGQLGTTSSSRTVKRDVREIGERARRLAQLRPVAFRYRRHAEGSGRTPLQFGLVAEEVAEVFPELVVRDDEGRPRGVKYHLLSALLLAELQRADAELAEQGAELAGLEERLRSLEADLFAGGRNACVAR
ncbi:MAG: tail fiber domain-containing protein [Thermoanaerobaculia bacterium]